MPNEKDGQDPSSASNGNPPPPPPLEATIEQRVMALESAAHAQREKSNPTDLTEAVKTGERWLIGINGCALLASIGIGIIYIFQLSAMRASNEISRQSLQSVQRAFMTFKGMDSRAVHATDGTLIAFGSNFENAGTTPADDIVAIVGVKRLPAEPNEAEFIGQTSEPQHSYLGPKGVGSYGPTMIRYSDTGFDRPDADIHPDLYMWGGVAYSDVFPGSERHLTEFCVLLRSFGMKNDGNGAILSVNCRKHNCADESCPDYKDIVSKTS